MNKQKNIAIIFLSLELIFIAATYLIVQQSKADSSAGIAYGMYGFPTGFLAIIVYIINLGYLVKLALRREHGSPAFSLALCALVIPILVVISYYINSGS